MRHRKVFSNKALQQDDFERLTHLFEALSLIAYANKRIKLLQLSLCLILCATGLYMIWYHSVEQLHAWDQFINISGGFIVGLTAFLLLQVFNPFIKQNSIKRLLVENRQKCVWIYPYIVENMPYGIQLLKMTTLYFCLDDGQKESLLTTRQQANKIMNALKPILLHTTFGYSEQKDFLYRANPLLLKN